jgi:hypothetical protein
MQALRSSEFNFLADLKQLQVLELGDCVNWSAEVWHHNTFLLFFPHLTLISGGCSVMSESWW